MTKYFHYYDPGWEAEALECPRCQWRGTFDQGANAVYGEFTDCHCPRCEITQAPMLAVRMHPTLGEMKQLGTPEEAAQAEQLIAHREAFWKIALTRAEQLPEIPGEEDLYLSWDADYSEEKDRPQTVIRHGDRVLFSEPASWEAIEGRYEAICRVLKEKYGARVRELGPTPASELWLYGDHGAGDVMRAFACRRVFGERSSAE